jgi:ribosomal protection tetracycline resistance protein
MRTPNLGILAHVDAGETTLTERLLYAAGIIDEVGRVDDGSTQTDTLTLERQRGITIKTAVVSFVIDDVTINLIDTPGHPDFIAEVERVLSTLDGAVLVISAVEGVQAQTRVLMRTLQRLGVPTLIFVNKIDRSGAQYGRSLRSIAERLTPAIIPMGSASGLGTHSSCFTPYGAADTGFTSGLVDLLADHDEAFLAAYVDEETPISYHDLRGEIPSDTFAAAVSAMARLRAAVQTQEMRGSSYVLEGEIPAARVHELQRRLPALTRGEGLVECEFDSYRPVCGEIPTRPRTDYNPLDRKEYLLHVMRRV